MTSARYVLPAVAALATAVLGGCPKVQPAPVSSVSIEPSTTGPVNSDATVTFTVTFDADVSGFDDPDADVQINHAGTAGGQATITAVDDQTFRVVVTGVQGNGSYTLAVPQGAGQDGLGNPTPGAESEAVSVDNAAPIVTVNALATTDPTPPLNGTIDDPAATITVTVGNQTRNATNNGNGTWTIADNTLDPLAAGTYDVVVEATDAAGNVGQDTTADELVIDTTAPIVTVNTLLTNNQRPDITGTIDEPTSTVAVVLDGQTYEATNNGDGTWTLPGADLAAPLSEGVYDVEVTATDLFQRTATDVTIDELEVDLTAPTAIVNDLLTDDPTPELRGTVDDPTATLVVTVDGHNYAVTNNNGSWTLPDDTISPALGEGTYNVQVRATDAAGNEGGDTTTAELTVNALPPVVSVNRLVTNNVQPTLTGDIDDPDATVVVSVDGSPYNAVNNGDGTWTLDGAELAGPLAEGTYDVQAVATDAFNRTTADSTTDELVIDLTAPTVGVDVFTTADSTPQLTGTIDDPDAEITVEVGGNFYSATNNGDGTWTLADNIIDPPLAVGFQAVTVTATDPAGNSDSATDTIIIIPPPQIIGSFVSAGNIYVDLTFDEPVWGDASQSTPIDAADFVLTYTANGDAVTDVTISSVKAQDNEDESLASDLTGGETLVRLFLRKTGGPATGFGTMEIHPEANSIFGAEGVPALTTTTTGEIQLRLE